jgi:hypothetical protein
MVSAFQSCEFGFGMDINPELLKEVNITKEGKKYNDTKAAISRRGTDLKKQLTSSPFIVEFKYAANLEGYWSYDHMVLQYTLSKKSWTGPSGETVLVLKVIDRG